MTKASMGAGRYWMLLSRVRAIAAIIAYVGVLPGHRGHGYAYDLLVEGTHVLVGEGAGTITADTDTTNTPMAATFARAGYPVTQRRLMLP